MESKFNFYANDYAFWKPFHLYFTNFIVFSSQKDNKEGRAIFPKPEYTNEWLPVGRGDPLKDPTYDYMPPVLDRVRYWADGNSQKNKNDVLVLGVSSKRAPANKPKDKFGYGPIKRTYNSPPYQSHYSSPHQQQQQHPQQYVSNNQFLIPAVVSTLLSMSATSSTDATTKICSRLLSYVNASLSTPSTTTSRMENTE